MLKDKVVVITGGAGLIGREFVKTVVEQNGTAVIADINKELGKETVQALSKELNSGKIDFTIEKKLLGTAGAVKLALQKCGSEFVIVLNCDDLTDIGIKKLEEKRENTICVAHPSLHFGRVAEKNGYAVFEEKPMLNDWVSCGWYLLNRKEMLKVLPDKGMLEYDVFPKIKLRIYKHEGFWKTFNTQKDVEEFEEAELPAALK